MTDEQKTTPNGVPVIEGRWEDVWPDGLMTKTQLSEAGYQTGKKLPAPAAALVWSKSAKRGGDGFLYLYDPAQAVPKRTMTDAQRAALEKAQKAAEAARYCIQCGQPLATPRRDGLCMQCNDLNAAVLWADAALQNTAALIMDTETTGLDTESDEIIEMAIMAITGETVLNIRIQPKDPDAVHWKEDEWARSAYDIHGISADDLRKAPMFPEVYPQIASVLTGRTVIIYNAEYDGGMLDSMCKRYGLPEIDYKPQCAMELYSVYVGDWSDYWKNYRYQPLPGGDHSALGDCFATLEVIKQMANDAKRIKK